MEAVTTADRRSADAHTHRTPPRRLLLRAAVAAVVADLVLMAIIGEPIPPLLVFAGLTAIAVPVLRRRPRPLAVVLAILAIAALGGGGAIVAADLAHPSDVTAFVWATLSGGGRLLTLVAAAMVLRDADEAARVAGRLALAGVAVALVITGVARATVSSDVAQPGDVEVVAVDTTYPDPIEVASGQTLFVDNQDEWRHTFAIEGTDVNVELPPSADRRVAIDLPPGTYLVHCTVRGHETMTATLEVRG